MFGRFRNRRMFRWAARRPFQASYLRLLGRANRLMAIGQNQEAGQLFERLAQIAQDTGHPYQAANLHTQAALCGARAGDGEFALSHARQALQGFQQLGMLPRAASFLAQITAELQSHGLANIAAELQNEFAGLPAAPLHQAAQAAEPQEQRRLPATCPQCGAPVRSDAVEWIDASSAECAYCGGVIPAR